MIKDLMVSEKVFKQQLNSSHMLNNLINDLIDLAKMENSKFNFNNEYFDLIETIHDTLEIMLFQANQKQIEFEVIIDKKQNLGLFHQIFGDSSRIRQILINFISNSLKFTPINGKVTIMI